MLVDLGSTDGITDWQDITPDEHHDWINQRDPTWKNLIRLGHKDARANKSKAPDTAVRLYSAGVKTNRDPYLYSFDSASLGDRAERMIDFYERRRRAVQAGAMTIGRATANDALHQIKWTRDMRGHLKRDTRIVFDHQNLRIVHHRPFVKQWLYYDPSCINEVYRIPAIFPWKADTRRINYRPKGWPPPAG